MLIVITCVLPSCKAAVFSDKAVVLSAFILVLTSTCSKHLHSLTRAFAAEWLQMKTDAICFEINFFLHDLYKLTMLIFHLFEEES